MTKNQFKKAIKEEFKLICIKDQEKQQNEYITLYNDKIERLSERIVNDLLIYVKLSNFNETFITKKKFEKHHNSYYVITFEISLHDITNYFNLSFNETITIFESDIQNRF